MKQLASMDFVFKIAGYPSDSSKNPPCSPRSLLDFQNLNLINPLMHAFFVQLYRPSSHPSSLIHLLCLYFPAMDKSQLRQKAAEMKRSLFDKGVLNSYFLNLEYIEEDQPNFVEEMIVTYFTQSSLYLDELRRALETRPLNMGTVERVIMKLKGGSASMGAARFNAIVSEMCIVFKRGETDRLYDEFQRVRAEHAVLRTQLEPYAELLRKLRRDGPVSDEASASHDDDVESSASNDMEG